MFELSLDIAETEPLCLAVTDTHQFNVPARGRVGSQSLNPGDMIDADTFNTRGSDCSERPDCYVWQERILAHNQNGAVCRDN